MYEGVSNECTALYLENKVSYDNSLFTFNEGTAIYEDLKGSYIYQGGDLIVTANLKPKTGRIRFTGTAGTVLKVYGITSYATYDIGTNIYTTSKAPFKIIVGEDGYTPYFYGYFSDSEESNVKVWIDAKEAYTRFCSKDIFNAGQSGKMTIPTVDSHNGWVDGLHFNVNGAQFKMVAVEGGTFTMGDPTSTDSYYTAHNVTLTGFCIAETEVTSFLWYRISNPEVNISTPDNPYYASSLYRSDVMSKIKKLNDIEEVSFDLPTEAQWEFAARGGKKTKGYRYSGSDVLDDVAWYALNSSDKIHEVKQKLPNELGIYDMSGNVLEWCSDWLVDYPTRPSTGSYRVFRGGGWGSSAQICRVSYRGFGTSNYHFGNLGFRLVCEGL